MDDVERAERAQRERTERAQTIARVDEVGKLIAKLDTLRPTAWKEEYSSWCKDGEPDLITHLDGFTITIYGRRGLPSDHTLSVSSRILRKDVVSYSGDGRIGDYYFNVAGKLRSYREEQKREEDEAESGKRNELRAKFFKFLGVRS